MQETYAVLAIFALQKKVGEPDQQSEDEFYAQFSETPWRRFQRLRSVFLALLRPEKRSRRFERHDAPTSIRTGEA